MRSKMVVLVPTNNSQSKRRDIQHINITLHMSTRATCIESGVLYKNVNNGKFACMDMNLAKLTIKKTKQLLIEFTALLGNAEQYYKAR